MFEPDDDETPVLRLSGDVPTSLEDPEPLFPPLPLL